MILPDNETSLDLLNNEAIAGTVVSLLKEQVEKPITIGVHGDWGAGKSSVLRMIETALVDNKEILCLKFNGWRFQGFEDAKIALLEGIVSGLLEKRPALTKGLAVVKNVLARIDWLKAAKKAGGLAFTTLTGIPTPDQLTSLVGLIKGFQDSPDKAAQGEQLSSALAEIRSVLKDDVPGNVPEGVREFHLAFEKLVQEAGVKRLVVLIDDLDRCLPETAIETLEAIRLFVFTPATAFVVAVDEKMIEYSVQRHFPSLDENVGSKDYGRNYIEKLIQVPIWIPAMGENETKVYVTLLLIGTKIGEADPQYLELVKAAKQGLTRPWEPLSFDSETVKSILRERVVAVQEELLLSEQLGPILAGGTKGNPRQVKRFLNALLLRKRTAELRGYGNDVKLPVLAKLMLAERFVSGLFEQLADLTLRNAEGKCPELKELENDAPAVRTSVAGKEGSTVPENVATNEGAADAIVAQWRLSGAIVSWAKLSPPIHGVDLRPYYFASKEEKDYFHSVGGLGPLSGIVTRLLGPKVGMISLEPDLLRLALPESEQVFGALKSSILSADGFSTRPAGFEGLLFLVKHVPALQDKLLDFLALLPAAKLGAWAATGYQGVIRDGVAAARLEQLFKIWKTTSGNGPLNRAADIALTPKKGGV